VANEGHKWFADSIALRDLRLKPGDVVLESRLNSDLNWMNRNNYQSLGYDGFNGSFRDVSASFHQGKLGETDVELKVEDRFPLRAFVGVEDSGIEVIGRDRLFAGFNWANVFGLDQRLNYQYITDTEFDKLKEHVASYVIPLPWRHELTFFGAYADLHPDFSVINTNFDALKSPGTFYQISARYAAPLPTIGKLEHEITAGFDFKRTDTPLLFEGSSIPINPGLVDIAQFLLGYGGRLHDAMGQTSFSLQGIYSPGGLTENNKDAKFNEFSSGSATKARYLYGRLEVRRETLLPYGFEWYLRGLGQLADTKLIATETFGIGGYDTVRGYDERVVFGDNGWLINNELRTPRFVLGNLTERANKSDWVQGLVFCDYGAAYNRSPLVNGQRYNEMLLSAGVGFRYAVADNFHVRFDYGFQLDREYDALDNPNRGNLGPQPTRRAHFGVELAF
jgi:hemolysin activation/secretion protein